VVLSSEREGLAGVILSCDLLGHGALAYLTRAHDQNDPGVGQRFDDQRMDVTREPAGNGSHDLVRSLGFSVAQFGILARADWEVKARGLGG
jgi:hypothetical protein